MASNGVLFGWFTPHGEAFDRTSGLRAMATNFPGAQIMKNCSNGLCIGSNGVVGEAHGDITVALIGKPYWKDDVLAEKAQHHGHVQVVCNEYLEKGEKFIAQLAGSFIVVVADRRRKRVMLFLDRIGQQHLYYYVGKDCVVFGTRIDAVARHPLVETGIRNQGLYNYFYFHAEPSPGTIYRGISKLENGQYAQVSNGALNVQRYWIPQFVESGTNDIGKREAELLPIIRNCISRQLDDVSTGAFLSGGLDSSTVAGMLSQLETGRVKTFSIGFDAEGYDEIAYARIAAKRFQTESYEYYVTPEDVVSDIERIAGFFDEPFGNSSALPAYFCARLAKENGVERMLAGDGGDELFAGNERYLKQQIFEVYGRLPSAVRNILLEPLFTGDKFYQRIPLVRKLSNYIRQARTPLPDRLESYNFLVRHEASEVFSSSFLEDVDQNEPINILRQTYNSLPEATSLNRMMWLDWKRTLHDNDLVKVNRMCELAGVQVAYPLLDDELIEYSCSIPSNMKIRNKQLRWFYKQAMKGFLPDEILSKRKHGFGLPFGVWTVDNPRLRQLAYDALDALKTREIFRPGFIDNTIRMHQSVHAKFYGELVWLLMMLEMWLGTHE